MSPTHPSKPSLSHLVLNVRDIQATHDFYTEMLGFVQVGQIGGPGHDVHMRFYQGAGRSHHDIAFVQLGDPSGAPAVSPWTMFPAGAGVVHIAFDYGSRDAWLAQIEHLQSNGVEFLVRGNHGMTHSAYIADPDGNGIEILYDLPPEVWEDDVNAALNHFEALPRTGQATLVDDTDYPMFGKR
jgi:catechol-2,3-dioxygenase